jgi:hypothetical protein
LRLKVSEDPDWLSAVHGVAGASAERVSLLIAMSTLCGFAGAGAAVSVWGYQLLSTARSGEWVKFSVNDALDVLTGADRFESYSNWISIYQVLEFFNAGIAAMAMGIALSTILAFADLAFDEGAEELVGPR